MRKFVIILLMLLLILSSSCTNKEKESSDLPLDNTENTGENNDNSDNDDNIKDSDNKDTDSVSDEENSDESDEENSEEDYNLEKIYANMHIKDGDKIFYVGPDYGKLYCIKEDGSEKTLIHEQERMFNIQIYDNRLYVFSSIYTDTTPPREIVPSKIESMNKDGSDVKIVDLGLEFTTHYHLSNFWIYKDLLFFSVLDYTSDNESLYSPSDLYKYDLKNNTVTNIHKGIEETQQHMIYDDICYYFVWEQGEYTLYKYDIYKDEKSSIKINKYQHPEQEKGIRPDIHVKDDYVYYHSKTYIDRDKLDGLSDTENIFENKDFLIIYMEITDEYIFFVNMEDNTEENIKNETMDLAVRRIKHDGSDLKIIFTETMRDTNLPPVSVKIIADDNTLTYKNRISDTFKIIDFEGNILE